MFAGMNFFIVAATLVATASSSCVTDENGKCTFTIVPYKIARLAHSSAAEKFSVAGMYDNPSTKLVVTYAGLMAFSAVEKVDTMSLLEYAVHFKYHFFGKAIDLLHETENKIFSISAANKFIRNNSKRANVVFAEYLAFLEDYYTFLMFKVESSLNNVLEQYSYYLAPGLRRILTQVTLKATLDGYIQSEEYLVPLAERLAAIKEMQLDE